MNQSSSNNQGIASLIVGIVGVVLSILGYSSLLGIIFGIVAIILSAGSKKEIGPNGMATAGLVLGIISIVFGVIGFVACLACGGLAACASCLSGY